MTKLQKIFSGILAVALLIVVGFYLSFSNSSKTIALGDVSHQGGLNVSIDGIGYGGYESSSTISSSETLSAAELQSYGYIQLTKFSTSGLTLILPASTSLPSFISVPGQQYTFILDNATTSQTNITIASNKGMLLGSNNTNSIIYGNTTGSSSVAFINFMRKQNSDIYAFISTTSPKN